MNTKNQILKRCSDIFEIKKSGIAFRYLKDVFLPKRATICV